MNLSSVDLKSLAVFRSVVDHRGFAGASTALHISRSAISFHMRALEQRLGFVACRRRRAGFELTDRGAIAYERARAMLAAVDDFDSEMGALRRTVVGTLRLGIVDNTITDSALPCHTVIGEFLRRNAGARIDVVIGSPENLVDEIASGELHLGLLPESACTEDLQYRRIHEERHSLHCASAHELCATPAAELDRSTIARHPFVVRPYANLSELRAFPGAEVGAHASNMEAQAMLILSGRFIGYLPDHYARRWVERGEIQPLMPETTELRSPFCIVTRAGRRPSLVVRSFIQELVAHSWQMAHDE